MTAQPPAPTSPPAFLTRHLPPPNPDRPHITLTWAQSLDAKIAGKNGSRVILSGPESMLMTHWLRTMHDAILVGINTIVLDDPRLKIQLIPPHINAHPPQPLILDPKLRFPLSSRILAEWNARASKPEVVRQPWILCGDTVDVKLVQQVEQAGARVIPVSLDAEGRIPPNALPDILRSLNLRSVMIEGGSAILSSFLRSPPRDDASPLVDSIIVTVAPMFIGDGIGFVPEADEHALPQIETVYTETMGKDAVMVCKIKA
ncbi:dihydrofolate reductase-like domain-containing protein [Papiliotrema laurentii]|uniref:2,5-diamino-6-ribosylamino-4(3H)-pyrimidinone 5'-phosphate reductase n=1 Tax=Papiliotrema laurentii TaxID=5418 RepID=A0AAD9FKV6_PAPLA|nr:dihydrofolate reductase-like domain-containing protein [Papiliotrema laurentii]